MSAVLVVLKVGAVAYAGACLLLATTQRRHLYMPGRTIDSTPADVGLPFEDVALITEDGETLHAWYVPAPTGGGNGFSLIFSHGNAGDIGDRVWALETLHRMGFAVLIYDYRGYGRSTGTPDEAGTYRDAHAAWAWLRDTRGVTPDRLVIYGRSLGAAVASHLATVVTPRLLIMESGFTSVPDMAARMFPWLPARALCRYRYDNRAHLARVACPVVIAHSVRDEMIPFEHARRLFAAAREPKWLVELSAGHNDGGIETHAAYRDRVLAVLTTP